MSSRKSQSPVTSHPLNRIFLPPQAPVGRVPEPRSDAASAKRHVARRPRAISTPSLLARRIGLRGAPVPSRSAGGDTDPPADSFPNPARAFGEPERAGFARLRCGGDGLFDIMDQAGQAQARFDGCGWNGKSPPQVEALRRWRAAGRFRYKRPAAISTGSPIRLSSLGAGGVPSRPGRPVRMT
jgi:hypothetical protein